MAKRRGSQSVSWLAFGVALGLVAFAPMGVVRGAVVEHEFRFDSEALRLADLIGHVRIGAHAGSDIRVVVRVEGKDATADLLRIEETKGRRAELAIRFPVEEHRRYVYPALGRDSRTRFRAHERENGWLHEMLGGREIEVRGEPFGDALEVWADVDIFLPAGKDLAVVLGVGAMEARDVRGNLDLDSQSGGIDVDQLAGHLRADTGSGAVHVASVQGDVDVDTGSGRVDVSAVTAAQRVLVDTGSGGVDVRDVEARELLIDTGSGGVEIAAARVEEMNVDTGSGGVEATGVAADGVRIDTGSGSVVLEIERMGSGRFEVDTGSGGIRLRLPRQASAVFDLDTGSGGIDVDVDGVELGRKARHEARFTLGDGSARVRLSTGSGGIRIRQGRNG